MASSKKGKRKYKFRICLIIFVCYMVGVLINSQIELSEKKLELENINQNIVEQQIANDELELILSTGNNPDYVERIAQEELDFAYPDEKVYIDISGN